MAFTALGDQSLKLGWNSWAVGRGAGDLTALHPGSQPAPARPIRADVARRLAEGVEPTLAAPVDAHLAPRPPLLPWSAPSVETLEVSLSARDPAIRRRVVVNDVSLRQRDGAPVPVEGFSPSFALGPDAGAPLVVRFRPPDGARQLDLALEIGGARPAHLSVPLSVAPVSWWSAWGAPAGGLALIFASPLVAIAFQRRRLNSRPELLGDLRLEVDSATPLGGPGQPVPFYFAELVRDGGRGYRLRGPTTADVEVTVSGRRLEGELPVTPRDTARVRSTEGEWTYPFAIRPAGIEPAAPVALTPFDDEPGMLDDDLDTLPPAAAGGVTFDALSL